MADCPFETQVITSHNKLVPGTILVGRFEVSSLIGKGAHGEVYAAKDLQLNCDVAIKVLPDALVKDAAQLMQFRNELLISRRISHPNVIRVHEFYQDPQVCFYTMDLINGSSLRQFISANKESIGLDDIQRISLQLFDGLAAAHEQGVLHCDIKPENILIDNELKVFISDFGIASFMGEGAVIYGSPSFSAPERESQSEPSFQQDIYSLAATLFELTYGQLPFQGATKDDIVKAKYTPLEKPKVRDKKRLELFSFFLKNLSVYPEQRHQDINSAKRDWHNAYNQAQAGQKALTKRLSATVISLVVIAAALFGFDLLSEKPIPTQEVTSKDVALPYQSVAVLPFHVQGVGLDGLELGNLGQAYIQAAFAPYNIHVLHSERIQSTLSHLGFKVPLSAAEKKVLVDLLGVSVLVSGTFSQLPEGMQLSVLAQDTRLETTQALWQHDTFVNTQALADELATLSEGLITALGDTPKLLINEKLSGNAAIHFSKAQQAYQYQDFDAAKNHLDALLKEQPNSLLGNLLAASLAFQEGNLLASEQYLLQVESKAPENTYSAVKAKALLAMVHANHDAAEQHFNALLAQNPLDTQLRFEFVDYLNSQGQFQKAKAQLSELVNYDAKHPHAWFELAKASIRTGDIQSALDDYLVKALIQFKKIKDKRGEATVLNAFGVAFGRQGKFKDAEDYYLQSLAIREQLDEQSAVAASLGNIALLRAYMGDYTEAERLLDRALEIRKTLDDRRGQALLYEKIALLNEEQGLYAKALTNFEAALNIKMSFDDPIGKAETMNNIGFTYFVMSQFNQALVYLKQAEAEFLAANDPLGIIKVRQNLAQLYLQSGEWSAAFQIFQTSAKDAKTLGLDEERVAAESYLARLAFLQGNFNEAEDTLITLQQGANEAGNLRGEIAFSIWLAEQYIFTAQHNKAQSVLAHLTQILGQETQSESYRRFKLLHIRLLTHLGRFDEANAAFIRFDKHLMDAQKQGMVVLPRLKLLALVTKNELALQGGFDDLFITQLPKELKDTADKHVVEYLYWLELQAKYALQQAQTAELEQVLNQALPKLRRMTQYWRQYQFDGLLYDLKVSQNKPASEQAFRASFTRLLNHIDELNQTAFITQNAYVPKYQEAPQ